MLMTDAREDDYLHMSAVLSFDRNKKLFPQAARHRSRKRIQYNHPFHPFLSINTGVGSLAAELTESAQFGRILP